MSKISLTVKLIKSGHEPKDCLKEQQEIQNKYDGQLVVKSTPSKVKWAKYLEQDLGQFSHGAVLFLEEDGQLFALCFGQGHHLIKPDVIEKKFGIIVALNSLDKDKLKSTDVFSPSDHSKQRRTQTTKDSSLEGHDFEGYSHILKKITGKVKKGYENLFKNITASDGVTISTDTPAENLKKLCNNLGKLYEKEDCKSNFPEVFHIQEIKDTDLKTKLDNQLAQSMQDQSNEVYITTPELIDFQEIGAYKFNLKDRKKNDSQENLEINNLYPLIANKGVLPESLKKWTICLLDHSGLKKYEFPIYETLVFDCSIENKNYHFTHGNWYEADKDFFNKISKEINKHKKQNIANIDLPHFQRSRFSNEEEYNTHLSSLFGKDSFLLDKSCIHIQGYDKIEPCDVLVLRSQDDNYFIHVKRKHGGSSGLSHLFNQGDISLTLLNNQDESFMNGLSSLTKVNSINLIENPHIHFLIIDSSNKPRIPLFSQISLHKTIQSIRSKRGKVSWSIVKEDD